MKKNVQTIHSNPDLKKKLEVCKIENLRQVKGGDDIIIGDLTDT